MCRSNETSGSPLLSKPLWKSLIIREKKNRRIKTYHRYSISMFTMLKGNNATDIII